MPREATAERTRVEAASSFGRGAPAGTHQGAGRVKAMVARHGPALLRVANQFSLCQDDALDAYQHALEIYLRRLETVEAATEGAFIRVVIIRTIVTAARQAPSAGHLATAREGTRLPSATRVSARRLIKDGRNLERLAVIA